MSVLTIPRRQLLRRRIRLVVAATITYNVFEAVISIVAGAHNSSTALIAFGLDSIVEVLSAAAVAWQFSAQDPETREKAALRLIGGSFFALAIYVIVDTTVSLFAGREATPSPVGIILSTASMVIMPLLSWLERRTGRELGSASAIADSRQTLLCSYLSGALLVGLVLNAWLGWWWADSLAALGIAIWAVKEGVEAWRGDACTTSVATLIGERDIE